MARDVAARKLWRYSTSGSGSDQVMSVLDSQISQSNQVVKNPDLDKVRIIFSLEVFAMVLLGR